LKRFSALPNKNKLKITAKIGKKYFVKART
jgi:hypothetical protein